MSHNLQPDDDDNSLMYDAKTDAVVITLIFFPRKKYAVLSVSELTSTKTWHPVTVSP